MMDLCDKTAWLIEHGMFNPRSFYNKPEMSLQWIANGGMIFNSYEPDHIADIYDMVKETLYEHISLIENYDPTIL